VAIESGPPKWLSLAVAAACVIALADLPYGYYQLLRIVVTGFAIWVAFYSYGKARPAWAVVFGLIAILYNPLFKISMSRDVHAVENVITALLVLFETLRVRRGH
jgi:hypothetical protein